MRRHIVALFCLATLSAGGAGCASAEEPPGTSSDELRECANGKRDVDDPSISHIRTDFAHASILASANTVPVSDLAIHVTPQAAKNFEAARAKGPFTSVVEIACVGGIGPDALAMLHVFGRERCGGPSSPAKADASPRTCGSHSLLCGSSLPLNANFDPQGPCSSPAPKGRFVREAAPGDDRFSMLPTEVTFSHDGKDTRFEGVFAGQRQKGLVQQREKRQPPNRLHTYVELRPERVAHTGEWHTYQMHLSEDGTRLRMDPVLGPVGAEIEAPTFTRVAP